MGWNHHAANLLRHVAARAVLLAEDLDPQPSPEPVATWVIYDDTNLPTSATLGHITWNPTS